MDKTDRRKQINTCPACRNGANTLINLIIFLIAVFHPFMAESLIIKPPANITEVNTIPPKRMAAGEKYTFQAVTDITAYKVYILINGKKYEMKGSEKTWSYEYRISDSGEIRYEIYAVNQKENQGKSKTGTLTVKLLEQPGEIEKPEREGKINCGELIGKNSQGYSEFKSSKDESTMIRIPSGEFTMGSNEYSDEKPVQTVFLDEYCIDKFLVANKQFKKFITETQYQTDAEKEGYGMVRIGNRWKKTTGANWKKPDGISSIEDTENHPVVQISHNDALNYCKWAGKRLPTEAEWEKAAKGIKDNKYPWGNSEPDDTKANYDSLIGTTTPVHEYEKGQSFYGLYDMAGNVLQWCSNWYGNGTRANKNPAGPKNGTEYVVKGGSFIEGGDSLRVANRDRYEPNYRSYLFGFRCAY